MHKPILTTFVLLIICLPALAGVKQPSFENQKDNELSTVKGTIDRTIQLIADEEYAEVLKTVVEPEDLQKAIKNKGSFEEVVKGFKSSNAADLLRALKFIRDKKPEYNKEGTIATFSFPKEVHSLRVMKLKKVNNKWYLVN